MTADTRDFSFRPKSNGSAMLVQSAKYLSQGQSNHTENASKDHVHRSGLPVRIQDGRHRTNMNLRKFFARDGDVGGFVRRARKSKKGFRIFRSIQIFLG